MDTANVPSDPGHSNVALYNWPVHSGHEFTLFRMEDLRKITPPANHDPYRPHRIGFHAVFLVTHGSGKHWVDFRELTCKRGSMIYIGPAQVHHFVKPTEPFEAWLLIFRPAALSGNFLEDESGGQGFMTSIQFGWPCFTQLDEFAVDTLASQFRLLRSLTNKPQQRQQLANRYLLSFLIAFAYQQATQQSEITGTANKSPEFLKFVDLVEESFRFTRESKWYAEQLGCSHRTLSRICREIVGKSAKEFIDDRVMIEARRILAQQQESISDIGQFLGFEETTNFVKFFRRHDNMTPLEFRKASRHEGEAVDD